MKKKNSLFMTKFKSATEKRIKSIRTVFEKKEFTFDEFQNNENLFDILYLFEVAYKNGWLGDKENLKFSIAFLKSFSNKDNEKEKFTIYDKI